MSLDEQEMRQQLEAVADHVSAPRFTIEGVISRIRRRRAKILGLVSGSLLAVAAIAVAVPVALSGPNTPPTAGPPTGHLFRLSFTVAVNGQSRVFLKNGSPPSFTVTPGEHLRIHIDVTVPAHAKVTTLWLGVTKDDFSPPGRHGQRPPGMRPVLAGTRKPLAPGPHTFSLTWTVPARLPGGTSLWLAAAWATKQQDARVAQPVAGLVTPR
jgi:hypothetical protein